MSQSGFYLHKIHCTKIEIDNQYTTVKWNCYSPPSIWTQVMTARRMYYSVLKSYLSLVFAYIQCTCIGPTVQKWNM